MDGKDYIAYFSMEIGLIEAMPTYAGGLGILAGDTVRSAADLGIRMVAVTLLHRKGYFHQKLDSAGWQSEQDEAWPVAELLQELKPRCTIEIEGRAGLRDHRPSLLMRHAISLKASFFNTQRMLTQYITKAYYN